MLVYSFNENGVLTGTNNCQPDPLSPGEFLIPPYTTNVPPPEIELQPGQVLVWNGVAWELQDVPAPAVAGQKPTWNAALQEWSVEYLTKPTGQTGKKVEWNSETYAWDLNDVPEPTLGEGETMQWNAANENWDIATVPAPTLLEGQTVEWNYVTREWDVTGP